MSADIVSEGCVRFPPIRRPNISTKCSPGLECFAALRNAGSRTGEDIQTISEVAAKFPRLTISPDPVCLQPPAARPPGESGRCPGARILFLQYTSSLGWSAGGMSPPRPGKCAFVGQLETPIFCAMAPVKALSHTEAHPQEETVMAGTSSNAIHKITQGRRLYTGVIVACQFPLDLLESELFVMRKRLHWSHSQKLAVRVGRQSTLFLDEVVTSAGIQPNCCVYCRNRIRAPGAAGLTR